MRRSGFSFNPQSAAGSDRGSKVLGHSMCGEGGGMAPCHWNAAWTLVTDTRSHTAAVNEL